MHGHLILPRVAVVDGYCHAPYEDYLRNWREDAVRDAEAGIAASSVCLQAVLIELLLEGQVTGDWQAVLDDLLTDNGRPLAYSKQFGTLLYGFDSQYLQSTVHAIHTSWWIRRAIDSKAVDQNEFAEAILAKKGSDSLIFDADVSPTVLRHRMKSELTLSAAMGIEILDAAERLNDVLRDELATAICDPRKIPPLGYMVAEQFRLAALTLLDREEQFPVGIGQHILACEEALATGWCDFAIRSKVDAYMGTASRTTRDKPIHSPLVACHVAALAAQVDDAAQHVEIDKRVSNYATALRDDPLSIPAFQMRDIQIPFGADLTPIEAICASHLIESVLVNSGE